MAGRTRQELRTMMPRQLWGIFYVHSRSEGPGLTRNAGGNIQNNAAGWHWGLERRTNGQADRTQFGALRRPHSGRHFSGCVLKPLNWNSCSGWWVYTLPRQPRVLGPPEQSPQVGPAWPGCTAAQPGRGQRAAGTWAPRRGAALCRHSVLSFPLPLPSLCSPG